MTRLPFAKILAYSCGSIGIGMFLAFSAFTVPLFSQDPLLMNIRYLALVQPFVGYWSDQTRTSIGRRAPFYLGGMVLGAIMIIGSGFGASDTGSYTLSVLAIFIAAILFNIGLSPYTALLADVTPSAQRGIVNGFAQTFALIGEIVILVVAYNLYGTQPAWVFALVGIGLAAGFAFVAWKVKESNETIRPESHQASGFNPHLLALASQQPDAVKLLGVRFLYALGVSAIPFFLVTLIATEIGLRGWDTIISIFPPELSASFAKIDPQGLAQIMAAILLLAPGVSAIPIGWMGDRFGKKGMLQLGLIACALLTALAAFAETVPQMLASLTALGLALAALGVLFFPYLADLVPSGRVGEFAGLGELAQVCGAFLSIPIVSWIIRANWFGLQSRLVFVFAVILLLLAFVGSLFVRGKLGRNLPTQTPARIAGKP